MPKKTLDVHAHFLPAVYRDALASAGLKTLDGGMPVPDWSESAALELMDQTGITGALLSLSSPFLSFLDAGDEAKLCRAVNIAGSEIRDRNPSRFGVLAILPMKDVDAALAELQFALDTLKLDGVAIPTNVAGTYLGDASFEKLFATLNDRRVTTFVHPTSPCCFEAFNLGLPAPMLEFPFDSTRAITDLVLQGRVKQYSEIEFIFTHAGGTVPFLANRIAGIGSIPVLGPKQTPIMETMTALSTLNYDLALSSTPQQYQALRALVPTSNILYGSDYPFTPAPAVMMSDAGVSALPFEEGDEEKVRFGNAARLFPTFAGRCCSSH